MLVAGHAITYLIVAPVPAVRERLLAASGHGYWRTAVLAAFVFGVYGAGRTVVAGSRRVSMSVPASFGVLVRRFAVLGAAAFAGLEVAERLASGAPLGDLAGRGILPLGLALQVALAVLAAAVLRLLYRAGVVASSHASTADRPRVVGRVVRPFVASFVPPAVADGAWGTRGPPHR